MKKLMIVLILGTFSVINMACDPLFVRKVPNKCPGKYELSDSSYFLAIKIICNQYSGQYQEDIQSCFIISDSMYVNASYSPVGGACISVSHMGTEQSDLSKDVEMSLIKILDKMVVE